VNPLALVWNTSTGLAACVCLAGYLMLSVGCRSASGGEELAGESPDSSAWIVLTRQQMTDAAMETGTATGHTFHTGVDVYGSIQVPPDAKASVHGFFPGYVREVRVQYGQRVSKGQVLFTLENPEYLVMQEDYLSARDQLVYLEADYQRQKNLAGENVTSQKNFAKAESDYRVMRTREAALAGQLRMMHIDPDALTDARLQSVIPVLSPIDGYVSEVHVARGQYLDPSVTAVALVNTAAQFAEFYVFEKDLQHIRAGQPIRFHLLDEPETLYEAVVFLTGRQIDPEHKTIPIHARLSEARQASRFTPGMYIEGFLETASDSLPALPIPAVVETEGKYFALRLDREEGDRFLFRQVEVVPGRRDESFIEIRNVSDFPKSSLFLTRGAYSLVN